MRSILTIKGKMPKTRSWPLLALLSIAVGCGPSQLTVDVEPGTGQSQGAKFTGLKTDAGIPVTRSTDATQFPKLVAANSGRFHARQDPFALSAAEKSFDFSQQAEKVFGEIGGFPTYVEPTETVAPTIATEQQPYRRLSGVVVGDSVLAIIEMGNGAEPQIIRPGMRIPNSPWTVVSINQDRAVLRRAGNILPKEIEVRLETRPMNEEPANVGGAPGGSGPSGFPGGAPPGAYGPGAGDK